MNYIDAYVTKVLSEPVYKYTGWYVRVEYNSYGVKSETDLFFAKQEQAEKVEIGYKFLV